VTKLEFLAAFRLACDTMPAETVDAAIAHYERQFTDLLLAGMSEAAIIAQWGTPQHAALKLKLGTFTGNLKQAVNVEKVARVGISGAGLMVLDLILLIPATVYATLLCAFYIVSLAVYLSGIFVSASSLAGVNYIDIPAHELLSKMAMSGTTHISLGSIELVPADIGQDSDDEQPGADQAESARRDPDATPERGFHIATHVDKSSIWKGISTTVAGMLLLAFCLLTTRFTFRLLRQFVAWHFTVLKNA